jgi:hypothetical protein
MKHEGPEVVGECAAPVALLVVADFDDGKLPSR